jgi:hypothetical protein
MTINEEFMFKFIKVFVLSSCLCAFLHADSEIKSSDKSKTDYKIIFDEKNAIMSEKTALNELKDYLQKITGADFTIVFNGNVNGKTIVLGYNKQSENFWDAETIKKLGEEEFLIKSSENGNIYIIGGRPRGTLYGVYHFLDNILGVRWLAPDYEFVPHKKSLQISNLDIHEKPAFFQRDANYFIHMDPEADYRWLVRNRFNSTKYDQRSIKRKLKSKYWIRRWELKNNAEPQYSKYGIKPLYAPPYFVHTLYRLIPYKKYFDKNPSWWEKIDGKRVNRKQASAMCLSNKELIAETAKNAIKQIDKYPDSKIISISENDGITQYCQCPQCQALIKKYGNTDSGLLLHFVNQVAEKIHTKYPSIMVETLAYIKTEKPPKNIKAGKNVLVRLCAWGLSHAIPYNAAGNDKGLEFFEKLKKWKKICPYMGIWDYVTTYSLNLTPHPNLHTIIPNLKAFYDAGVNSYFFEADHNQGGYRSGESLARAFLMSRGLWNPNLNTEVLIRDFTDAYYGKEAGKFVRKYWALLEKSNKKANYTKVYQAGNSGKAPYLSLEVMLEADKLLKKAMQEAKQQKHKENIQKLQLQVDYVLLYNWREFEKEAEKNHLKLPAKFDMVFADFDKKTKKFQVKRINARLRKDALAKLKRYYYQDFSVSASKCYNSKPEDAFDDNLRSCWNGSDFSGWVEIKFNKPKLIKSINTVFYKDKEVNYTILGSMDGEKWHTLVPRKTISTKKLIQKISATRQVLFSNDKIKPETVKYVKTKVFKAISNSGKRNWIVIHEQSFN